MLTDEVNSNNVISIHALLAESDAHHIIPLEESTISIHALLAESDIDKRCEFGRHNRISIHALLAESDAAGRFLLS